MKLIAWDTSSKSGCVVALEWEEGVRVRQMSDRYRLVAELQLSVDATQHSEGLLWGIDQVLQAAKWKKEEVNLIGVGLGPGSFTGLRIGVTTARTLGQTLNKKIIGVSSLSALTRPSALWLSEYPEKTLIIAAQDAAKGEVYCLLGAARSLLDCAAMADGDSPGLWKRGVEEKLVEPASLLRLVKRKLSEHPKGDKIHWMVVGEAREKYADLWKDLNPKLEIAPPVPFLESVQGRYLGMLCWEAHQGGILRNPTDIHPRYLRASEAEVKMEKGELEPSPTVAPSRKKSS
jgi:tRNA threonylcarbamoyl adenosine modification protein YeaZ